MRPFFCLTVTLVLAHLIITASGTGNHVDSGDSQPAGPSGTAGTGTGKKGQGSGGPAMTEVLNPYDGTREIEFSNGTRIDGGFGPTPGSEISVPKSEFDPVNPFPGSRSSRNRNLNSLAFPESTDGGFVEPNNDPTAGLFGN